LKVNGRKKQKHIFYLIETGKYLELNKFLFFLYKCKRSRVVCQ